MLKGKFAPIVMMTAFIHICISIHWMLHCIVGLSETLKVHPYVVNTLIQSTINQYIYIIVCKLLQTLFQSVVTNSQDYFIRLVG